MLTLTRRETRTTVPVSARVRTVYGALLLCFLLAALDQTIVATALPTIVRELGGLDQLFWVVTAYTLAGTVATPLWGKLGDIYGRKRIVLSAIVIFLLGSGLCGASRNLVELIGFRAVQGLGGGGLSITAMAIIADLFAPQERARYQGIIGAVFGVSSVAGPLVGGWFVDHLSWHWIFYVNIPVGLLALAAIALALHLPVQRRPHAIDYLGFGLITLGATGLVVLATLGGTTFPWMSGPIAAVAVGSVALLAAFVWVERRAAEPVIPPALVRNPVVFLTSAIGFVALFALVGATTYISLFLQVVAGSSPTGAGLRLAPMTGGVFLSSIITGQVISRTGRYKVFPLVGTALMALAMLLLSRLSAQTTTLASSGYLLLLGLGIGLVIQVMIVAVQNAVDRRDIGAATATASFFRSLGGSFGVAVFGALFANLLAGRLTGLPGQRSGMSTLQMLSNPGALDQLSAAARAQVTQAMATSLDTVFLAAAPIAAIAWVLTLFLPEAPLRRQGGSPAPGKEPASPSGEAPLVLSHAKGGKELSQAQHTST
jgi:EmrB/QacA subfamily drug resistance transporter